MFLYVSNSINCHYCFIVELWEWSTACKQGWEGTYLYSEYVMFVLHIIWIHWSFPVSCRKNSCPQCYVYELHRKLLLFITGVINATAPNPVTLAEMCEQLGSVLGRPSWLPVPEIALKAVLGEGAAVVRNFSWTFLLFLSPLMHSEQLGLRLT